MTLGRAVHSVVIASEARQSSAAAPFWIAKPTRWQAGRHSRYSLNVKTTMKATIAVRTAAAPMAPSVGSVAMVTVHNATVSNTQTLRRNLDTELITCLFISTILI